PGWAFQIRRQWSNYERQSNDSFGAAVAESLCRGRQLSKAVHQFASLSFPQNCTALIAEQSNNVAICLAQPSSRIQIRARRLTNQHLFNSRNGGHLDGNQGFTRCV